MADASAVSHATNPSEPSVLRTGVEVGLAIAGAAGAICLGILAAIVIVGFSKITAEAMIVGITRCEVWLSTRYNLSLGERLHIEDFWPDMFSYVLSYTVKQAPPISDCPVPPDAWAKIVHHYRSDMFIHRWACLLNEQCIAERSQNKTQTELT